MNTTFLIFLLGLFFLVAVFVVAIAKEEQHYVKEALLNQTLEIPCLEDTTSENLSNYPLKWLVVSIFHLQDKFQKELRGIFCGLK